jgi:hypothetical protein
MLAVSIVFAALVYAFVNTKDKKKLRAVCSIQSQTEEAEALNFQIHLYEEDSDGIVAEKINSLFEIAEGRRSFNNERIQKQMKEAQEEARRTLESLKN